MAWFLEITDEEGGVDRVALAGDDVIIGRSALADVLLQRPSVSRRHAQLVRKPSGWLLMDLGSRSGTYVNGGPVERCELSHNDTIEISHLSLRLIDDAIEDAEQLELTTHWSAEARSPDISTLAHGVVPKLDWKHISELNAFGRSLMEDPSSESRLRALCNAVAGGVLNANWALVLDLDADAANRPAAIRAAWPADMTTRHDVHISRTTLQAVQKHGSPVLASNFSNEADMVEMSVVEGSAAAAVAACPLDEGGQTCRVLYVNLPPAIGTTQWLAVIALAAKAYQQAEATWREREAVQQRAAMDRDLDNARSIQRSILPPQMDLAGLDIAWSFQPCDAVGGDYLDILKLSEDKVLIAIADVSGHGLAASLATLSIHSVLQTCMKSGMTGEQMMSMLDEHLETYLPGGRFVTMLVVTIDLRSGKTECVNAGHHPPEVLSPAGAKRTLANCSHLVLGVAPSGMSSDSDQLQPGETMLLFTDGLCELRGESGKMLQTAGVVDMLSELHADEASAEMLVKAMRSRLDEAQGTQPSLDDQTFMVIRRL